MNQIGPKITGTLTAGNVPVATGASTLGTGSWTDTGTALSTASTVAATSTLAVTGLTTAVGGVTTPANLTTTGTGALVVAGTATITGNSAMGGAAVDPNAVLNSASNATNPAAQMFGASFLKNLVLSAANTQSVVGGAFVVGTAANAFGHSSGTLTGGDFSVQNSNTATVQNETAGRFTLYNVGAGTITNGVASDSVIRNLVAGGTITNAYGARSYVEFNTGTIANTYGFYAGDVTSGTQTNQAYSFYASDANARNYFGGTTSTFPGDVVMNGNVNLGDASTDVIKFFGGTGSAKPTIAGSRGANAALADLLTKLATMGLIVDGTTV